MLAAAFIFLAFHNLLCDYWCVGGRDPGAPGVTVWPWLFAVGAQLSLVLGEVEDEIGGNV